MGRQTSNTSEFLVTGTGIAALALVTAVLIWLSPSEKTLGYIVKLVYLHLAVAWTGLLFFAIAGFLGLIGVFAKGGWTRWSLASQRTALLLWAIYLVSSFLVAYLAWGGINWGEPRLRIGLTVLWLALVTVVLTLAFEAPRLAGLINFVLAVSVWSLWATRFDVLHPASPVWRSNSSEVKIYSALILATVFATAALIARGFALVARK